LQSSSGGLQIRRERAANKTQIVTVPSIATEGLNRRRENLYDYRVSDNFEQRRILMHSWRTFAGGPSILQKIGAVIIVTWLTLALSGCGAQPTLNPVPAPTAAAVAPAGVVMARSDLQRDTAPQSSVETLTKLTDDNAAFAFDLYQAIRGESGNLFYSPHSISTALAMTYAGARNHTEQQMAKTLRYTLPQAQLHPAFNALDLKLTTKDHFTLHVANSLWGQAGFPFRQPFLDTIAINYGAGLRLLDFIDESRREQSRLTINQWVSDQTANKIQELLAKGILTQDTRLVLANAIYFKADWEFPFKGQTVNAPFTLSSSEVVTVPTMSQRLSLAYAKGPNYEAVELPYKGKRIRMVIILPTAGQLQAVEGALSSEQVKSTIQAMRPTDVKIYLPKFSYQTNLMLKKFLVAMGMSDAFDAKRADFSGMSERDLFIAHVVHKAFVAVNELGTEAAAATAVVIEVTSLSTLFNANRPFIFLIRDTESGAALFVGRVVDPR
jgi:serpin B